MGAPWLYSIDAKLLMQGGRELLKGELFGCGLAKVDQHATKGICGDREAVTWIGGKFEGGDGGGESKKATATKGSAIQERFHKEQVITAGTHARWLVSLIVNGGVHDV